MAARRHDAIEDDKAHVRPMLRVDACGVPPRARFDASAEGRTLSHRAACGAAAHPDLLGSVLAPRLLHDVAHVDGGDRLQATQIEHRLVVVRARVPFDRVDPIDGSGLVAVVQDAEIGIIVVASAASRRRLRVRVRVREERRRRRRRRCRRRRRRRRQRRQRGGCWRQIAHEETEARVWVAVGLRVIPRAVLQLSAEGDEVLAAHGQVVCEGVAAVAVVEAAMAAQLLDLFEGVRAARVLEDDVRDLDAPRAVRCACGAHARCLE